MGTQDSDLENGVCGITVGLLGGQETGWPCNMELSMSLDVSNCFALIWHDG